jgi:Heterokaryon incompatibility protein (HET)
MSSSVPQISTAWIDHNVQSLDCGFQYDALSHEKSFRLLKLLPSSDTSSTIICTMFEQSMDESRKKYAALSYTWGSMQDKKEIILNGRPALVTLNLYMALRHIRHTRGLLGNILQALYLWVDALCINQQDQNEKAVQIGYMYQIFANSQYVVAWLGPEGDESEVIMDAIKQEHSFDLGSVPVPALLSFFNRPWWTRVWVLQECMAASAASFMWLACGSSYTAFIHVFAFVNKVMLHIDRQSYYIERTTLREVLSFRWHTLISMEAFQKEQSFSLYDIIKISSKLKATDSRDKIFALLGLVDGQTKLQLQPDYTLSPCEVFCKAIRLMANDIERSSLVVKKIDDLKGVWSKGHEPLKENVHERLQCNGVACSSQYLCFDLPSWVSGDVSDLVGSFIMGLQDPKTK